MLRNQSFENLLYAGPAGPEAIATTVGVALAIFFVFLHWKGVQMTDQYLAIASGTITATVIIAAVLFYMFPMWLRESRMTWISIGVLVGLSQVRVKLAAPVSPPLDISTSKKSNKE